MSKGKGFKTQCDHKPRFQNYYEQGNTSNLFLKEQEGRQAPEQRRWLDKMDKRTASTHADDVAREREEANMDGNTR